MFDGAVLCEKCGHEKISDDHIIACVFHNNLKARRVYNTDEHFAIINDRFMKVVFVCSITKKFCYCANPFFYCPFCGRYISRKPKGS